MRNQNPVIDAAIKEAMGAVKATAAKNTNNIASKSVEDATPELTTAIDKAISANPIVQNATNTEAHWYSKRSMWSALASTIVVIGTVGHGVFEYMATSDLSDSGLSFGVIVGAVWAGYSAYRAGTALTPLGTKVVPFPQNKG